MKGWKTIAWGVAGILGGSALAIYVPDLKTLGYELAYTGVGLVTLRLGMKGLEARVNEAIESFIEKARARLAK